MLIVYSGSFIKNTAGEIFEKLGKGTSRLIQCCLKGENTKGGDCEKGLKNLIFAISLEWCRNFTIRLKSKVRDPLKIDAFNSNHRDSYNFWTLPDYQKFAKSNKKLLLKMN